MKSVIAGLLVVILVSVVACSKSNVIGQAKPFPVGEYQYSGYDKKGTKIVEGRVSITSVETKRIGAEDTIQLKGNWQLNKIGNPEHIGGQTGTGDLVGSIIKGEIDINLNPNISDANVYLRGTIEGRRFHGKWTFSGYAGPVSEGTFEAIRK
ncbi:MAG TPA: hypothetical protein VN476_02615 [Pyrinomonadaceae bacterium]|nr:hypothetical protein [Pyrinomonadaceae bacterium]